MYFEVCYAVGNLLVREMYTNHKIHVFAGETRAYVFCCCSEYHSMSLSVALNTRALVSQVFQVLVASLVIKPLINSTFNHGLPEGPSHPVLTIIKELLTEFES